ncbi:thermonuclease family protein [Sphingomicrobium sp. XHP0235]|uniref:thermonuclease family protein n=1 Tax=Sphingomicrobium aquimarinum TaxID=3133971 RepID=UPI0031FF447D
MIADCPAPYVVDGDSVNCGEEKLRQLGIDAPEYRCPKWRVCAPGDPEASKRSLQQGMRVGRFTYRVVSVDRYGRKIVVAYAGRTNLACWQLDRRQAVYVGRWDNGGLTARECGR